MQKCKKVRYFRYFRQELPIQVALVYPPDKKCQEVTFSTTFSSYSDPQDGFWEVFRSVTLADSALHMGRFLEK